MKYFERNNSEFIYINQIKTLEFKNFNNNHDFMKAKKSFGQHFLIKEDIAMKIVNSLILKHTYKSIIEVGPGKGVLTKYLAEFSNHDIFCIDADKDMIAFLEEDFRFNSVKLIQSDFLKINLSDIAETYAVIGNFPYNISSQIVFKIINNKENIPEMVGMFQKEVAERIVSGPNSKKYGIISVLTQLFYDAEYLFSVGPNCFSPPPKVNSGVIRLIRKDKAFHKDINISLFKSIVKISFGKRRKMLRNSLRAFFEQKNIESSRFLTKRPENLSVEDFKELCSLLDQ